MRSVITLVLGILIAAAGSGLRAQTQPAQQPAKPGTPPPAKSTAKSAAQTAAPAPTKPAAQTPPAKTATPATSKPAASAPAPAAKPAAQAAKPAAPPAKTTAQAPVKPVVKPAAKPATPAAKPATKTAMKAPIKPKKESAEGTGPEGESKQARRDPFESLVSRQQNQANAAKNLPPGKAGLQVSTLRLDGIVRAPNGMIAVVTNPQARTYFLREGDQLYDGRVEKIAMDGVSFHELGKDAFGKPVERQVNKRIYSSAGEQQ
jgi:Tfp pilus assembly protein PilP